MFYGKCIQWNSVDFFSRFDDIIIDLHLIG